MQAKQCSKCREVKEVGLFVRDSSRKDGFHIYCKQCRGNKLSKVPSVPKQPRQKLEGTYYQRHKQSRNLQAHLYNKRRMAEDPLYKFRKQIRGALGKSFKRACQGSFTKTSGTLEMLGCSYEHFISHITSQFTEGMTLENYGQWHLDHIIPLATASTLGDILRLNHYTNFQPLWAKDNLSKGCKIF